MLTAICTRLGFPKEAIIALNQAYEKLSATGEIAGIWKVAKERLFRPGDQSFLELLEKVSQLTDVHRYTADMVFLLLSAIDVREGYLERGYAESQYWDNMEDLRYKLMECWNRYGIWGTFVTFWYKKFFTVELFKLGRLQYNKAPFYRDDYRGIIKKDEPVLTCHIPSSGPLKPEEVLDSLKRAYAFYRDDFKDGIMVLTCHSWLLYTPQYEVYPENSNLRHFYDMFDVLDFEKRDGYQNFWHIYNRDYDPEKLNELPTKTGLQRNMLKFVKEGNPMGVGYGVLLFDGEKIIN